MNKKDFKIDINDYKVVKHLGNGSYGVVYLVKNTKTEEIYAAKVINSIDSEDDASQMLNKEIKILKQCQHPSVVRFYGFSRTDFYSEDNYTLLFEYCEHGSLKDFLNKVDKGRCDVIYTNTHRQIILIGIARGLMYLHQKRIIHRDLKPDNILIDAHIYPHITDFGLSQSFQEYEPMMSQSGQGCGTPIYMAPEVMEEKPCTSKADIYAFGLIMYEVITETQPYSGIKNACQLISRVLCNERPEFTIPVKEPLKLLIKKCWSENPDDRPTSEEVFSMLAYGTDPVLGDVDDDKTRYFLEDVDEEVVQEYIDFIKDDENIDNIVNNESNSLKAIQDLSKKIDQMQARVEFLQKKKTKSDDNDQKDDELSILEKIKEERKSLDKKKDLKIIQLENEITSLYERIENIDSQMKKRFNDVDNRFRILTYSLNSVVIPNDMVQIPYASFMNCSNLEKVVFSSSVKVIGNSAFFGCSSLKEINIPDSVTLIDKYAFAKCSSLKKVVIPASVKNVGRSAFKHCVALTKVKVSSSTSFGESVFRGCKSLKKDPSKKTQK